MGIGNTGGEHSVADGVEPGRRPADAAEAAASKTGVDAKHEHSFATLASTNARHGHSGALSAGDAVERDPNDRAVRAGRVEADGGRPIRRHGPGIRQVGGRDSDARLGRRRPP